MESQEIEVSNYATIVNSDGEQTKARIIDDTKTLWIVNNNGTTLRFSKKTLIQFGHSKNPDALRLTEYIEPNHTIQHKEDTNPISVLGCEALYYNLSHSQTNTLNKVAGIKIPKNQTVDSARKIVHQIDNLQGIGGNYKPKYTFYCEGEVINIDKPLYMTIRAANCLNGVYTIADIYIKYDSPRELYRVKDLIKNGKLVTMVLSTQCKHSGNKQSRLDEIAELALQEYQSSRDTDYKLDSLCLTYDCLYNQDCEELDKAIDSTLEISNIIFNKESFDKDNIVLFAKDGKINTVNKSNLNGDELIIGFIHSKGFSYYHHFKLFKFKEMFNLKWVRD